MQRLRKSALQARHAAKNPVCLMESALRPALGGGNGEASFLHR
jgi:hypothetical protein